MMVYGVQPNVERSCACLNPTTHLHTLTTLYHHSISLVCIPLAAVLSAPHMAVKMARVGGSTDEEGGKNK